MITLSMIVKNEETYLQKCLDSIKGIVDEIVIVDTGSTDRTIEIAKNNNAKIFSYEWNNDFAAARNYALQNSTGNWILYLDADERLAQKSINELKNDVKKNLKIGYLCTVTNINDVKGTPAKMSYVRLFANSKNIYFEGKVHEQIEASLRKNGYQIKQSNIEIYHFGYNVSNEKIIEKANRNLNILQNEFSIHKTSYYAFQIGQTYGILNDKENAIKYFSLALRDQNLKNEYKSLALRYLAVDYAEKNMLTHAEDLITKSLQSDSDQPLALLVASKIKSKLSKQIEAEKLCRKAFEVNNQFLFNNKTSAQTIFLDEETFLYQALNIAVLSKSKSLFNFFYPKLFSNDELKMNEQKKLELELVNKLMNNSNLEDFQIDIYAQQINERNLEVIISLLGSYQNKESKINLMNAIKNKFNSNYIFLNEYGLLLLNEKKYDDAEVIFENSYKTNCENPSTIFYLISSYIHTNKIDKILPVINYSEKKFNNYPEVMNRIKLVKQKISNIK